MSDLHTGWYAAAGAATASVRLRCLVPIEELRRQGRSVSLWQRDAAQTFDVMVFSKAYDERAYEVARELRARGTRIVLDLCDNHWFGEETHPAVAARAARLGRMLDLADLATVSTPVLAEQIGTRFRCSLNRIRVVPDPVLLPEFPTTGWKGRWELVRLRRFLNRHPGASHLVWFGNHGAGHVRSGMEDLDRIRPVIDAADGIFTLTIVSNSAAKFRALFGRWRMPVRYVPWRLDTVDQVLASHDAAVIPITRNDFTVAKTMNRPATALLAGLDVFADRIPSYDELVPFVTLDNWPALRAVPPRRSATTDRNAAAEIYLAERYSARHVGTCWARIIDELAS